RASAAFPLVLSPTRSPKFAQHCMPLLKRRLVRTCGDAQRPDPPRAVKHATAFLVLAIDGFSLHAPLLAPPWSVWHALLCGHKSNSMVKKSRALAAGAE